VSFGYQSVTSAVEPHSGKRCGAVLLAPGVRSEGGYGSLFQVISARPHVGRRVRLTAWVRADHPARARVWIRALPPPDRADLRPAHAGILGPPLDGGGWREHVQELEVPLDAESVEYGLAVSGEGGACLDDVRLQDVQR
jgi:hypothetical protein